MDHILPSKYSLERVSTVAQRGGIISCDCFKGGTSYYTCGVVVDYDEFLCVMRHLYLTAVAYEVVYDFNGPNGPVKAIWFRSYNQNVIWMQDDPAYSGLKWTLRTANAYESKAILQGKSPLKRCLSMETILGALK